jgi:hypothetical protein
VQPSNAEVGSSAIGSCAKRSAQVPVVAYPCAYHTDWIVQLSVRVHPHYTPQVLVAVSQRFTLASVRKGTVLVRALE